MLCVVSAHVYLSSVISKTAVSYGTNYILLLCLKPFIGLICEYNNIVFVKNMKKLARERQN